MDSRVRDYENVLPECGNPVMIMIKGSNQMGIYVSLLEFDNIEGLLLFSEVSRRRIRSMNKIIKTGKKEIVSVIRVDNDKSYIDVSKRQISEIEISYLKKKRSFGKMANLISNNISRFLALNFEEIRLRFVWPLGRKFSHPVKAFKLISKFENFLTTSMDLSKKEQKVVSDHLKKKIPINIQKIEVEFEMMCFSSTGVQVLKNSIIMTQNMPQFSNVQCKILVSPRYIITLSGKSKKKTMNQIIKFLISISEEVISKNGIFRVNKINFN